MEKRSFIPGLLIAVALLQSIWCDTGGGGSPAVTYAIGDTGPAGGLIFYIDEADAFSWTYLEVAPKSTEWKNIQWGKYGTSVSGTGTAIGTGKANTDLIVAKLNEAPADSDRAAQLADALSHGGYDDWFLPSKDELNAIWTNLVDNGKGRNSGVGGFGAYGYWSSSEGSSLNAWLQSFFLDLQNSFYKDLSTRVRAVRAF